MHLYAPTQSTTNEHEKFSQDMTNNLNDICRNINQMQNQGNEYGAFLNQPGTYMWLINTTEDLSK